MAYVPTENRIGLTAFTVIDSTSLLPIGTIVRGADAASGKGGGEFIYLPGVGSTVVGSMVTYDTVNKTTTLLPNTANLGKPVAVAMSANTSTANCSWYQIEGVAVCKKTAVKVNPAVKVFISGTTGRIMPTAASGKQINGAITVNAATIASATSTVNVLLQRPVAQGQVI